MCTLRLLLVLITGFSSQHILALDGDADPAFGTNAQVALLRPQQTPCNCSQPTGELENLPDGRFPWATPLDDGSVWLGRAARDGLADPMFGIDGNGRSTLPGCGQ